MAVVSIARGRHDHLRGQLWGLARQRRSPDLHVVVAMDDPDLRRVAGVDGAPWETVVTEVPVNGGRLPLAAARNAGVAAASARGADVLVLLDVDCIPGPELTARYTEVLAPRLQEPSGSPAVACGEVRYLDAATSRLDVGRRTWRGLEAGSAPHPARPAPAAGTVQVSDDARLFWSLSFALTPADWRAVGGFDEGYVGYGAEDTDFGQRLTRAHGTVLWLGGATAYHQHHGPGGLPLEHVDDVVANAARFARRWGWWPMEGWLREFEELGLVARDAGGRYRVVSGQTHAGTNSPPGA